MMSAAPKLSELFAARHDAKAQVSHPYDVTLILIALALMSIGIIIVTSASMPVADRLHDNPFYFAIRHGIYIVGAIVAAMVVLQLPMQFWRMSNPYLLLAAIGLLVAVLLIGRTVNGSTRWLAIGPITIQAAEPAKLVFLCLSRWLPCASIRGSDRKPERFYQTSGGSFLCWLCCYCCNPT